MNKSEIAGKYTTDPEVKLVLAQILDKMEKTRQKNILTMTGFLNEHQRAVAGKLIKDFGNPDHVFYGGYEGAQRAVLIFLPDYIRPEEITDDDINPLSCIRAKYSSVNSVTHRDILGAILGTGLKREVIGDILVNGNSSDIIVMKEVVPYLESNFSSAGKTKLEISVIPLSEIRIPEAKFKIINDMVASLRLDSVVSSAFSVSREKAAEAIKAGRVFLNYLECNKTDKQVNEGDFITVRGMGKAVLQQVGGKTGKGRIRVVIAKYI
ncbi:RNA-binding protein [Thermoclostridium stercorarium subsp. leptospartum DSM 9219]|uniref:RNA-binding protein n=1 Tax=Thermoclostridium stercorarium subsp. leptospartum DSM 9219 TaxID=1346611 RepID=A0A1B1YL52_THEST|nr:YlmH/Sll1252 family protein [Thermoclostridium stercorarium]ANX01498.1 RNA-binding protein [Thermoclostridium stercorarium subsp. leptospartum DSM 9219]